MTYYPVFLNVTNKKALVVGGGPVAQRKVESLLDYCIAVSLVSRELTPVLKKLVDEQTVHYAGPRFDRSHLEGMFLVIAATDDAGLNRRVSHLAQAQGLLVNAVDQPEDCTFIVPSIIRRGDLQVAISTSGRSPALARKIREDMEVQFGEEYEKLLSVMGKIREVVLSRGLPQEQNKRIFNRIIESDILGAITTKDRGKIHKILRGAFGSDSDWVPVLDKLLESEEI